MPTHLIHYRDMICWYIGLKCFHTNKNLHGLQPSQANLCNYKIVVGLMIGWLVCGNPELMTPSSSFKSTPATRQKLLKARQLLHYIIVAAEQQKMHRNNFDNELFVVCSSLNEEIVPSSDTIAASITSSGPANERSLLSLLSHPNHACSCQ